MNERAMCPGSFDPITYGHIDIIGRTARIFDEVVVSVFDNPNKQHCFPCEKRLELATECLRSFPNVVVERGEGLLVDCARKRGIKVVIKGLRAVSDFEYEFQMAQMNRAIANHVETLFMMTKPEHSYLSSSVVKELAALGADVSGMVPEVVVEAFAKRLGEGWNGDEET